MRNIPSSVSILEIPMQMFNADEEHPEEVKNVRARSAGLDLYTQDGEVALDTAPCEGKFKTNPSSVSP